VVEWVEVRGKSIDVAVAAAMNELGVSDRARVDVEVVQEPEKGFLGLGGRDAIVRVKPRLANRTPRGRRQGRDSRPGVRSAGGNREPGRGNRADTRSRNPRAGQRSGDGNRPARPGAERQTERGRRPEPRPPRPVGDVDANAQAPAVEAFLSGLVGAFGLEGAVSVAVEEDIVVAAIEGEQTEALVGPRGSVMEAIHEITKTVLHRQFVDTARVRIDIAGYAQRRRQALSIYAKQLIEQVAREGGEIMLEPMSAADRKVIHDAVAEVDGVISYSEGEPPRRYVVIAQTTETEEATPEPEPEETGAEGS